MMNNHIKRLQEPILKSHLKEQKVIIILGARQVGKTYLINEVVPSEKCRRFDLDSLSDLAVLQSLEPLAPADAMARMGDPKYIVIDEAQRYENVGRIVKSWHDAKMPVKVIVSGSSSLNILDKTAEPLTGRNIPMMLAPLMFGDTVRTQEWFHPSIRPQELSGPFKEQADGLLMQHMAYGCYPECAYSDSKESYLKDLVDVYLLRDVLKLSGIREPEALSRLLYALAYQTGQLVNFNELATKLGVSRQTVEKYIEVLEKSYVVFRLRPYFSNRRKEIFASHKVYFCDTGIRNALINNFSMSDLRPDLGQLFENYVIAEFYKLNQLDSHAFSMHFWQNRNGSEVDLVLADGDKLYPYEMKWGENRKAGLAFVNEYHKAPTVINRANAPEHFLSLYNRQVRAIPGMGEPNAPV